MEKVFCNNNTASINCKNKEEIGKKVSAYNLSEYEKNICLYCKRNGLNISNSAYKKEAEILLNKRGQSLWANDYNYGIRFELTEDHVEVYQSAFVMGGGGCPQDKKEPSYTMTFEEFYNKYSHHYEGII